MCVRCRRPSFVLPVPFPPLALGFKAVKGQGKGGGGRGRRTGKDRPQVGELQPKEAAGRFAVKRGYCTG